MAYTPPAGSATVFELAAPVDPYSPPASSSVQIDLALDAGTTTADTIYSIQVKQVNFLLF